MRVLVVDDDETIRRLLGVVLPLEGIEVVGQADDGVGALEEVARLTPDGVVLDLRMPSLDGWETTRRLHERHPATRVVVYTSEPPDRTAPLVDLGAHAVVRKPAGGAELARALLGDDLRATATVNRDLAPGTER